MVLPVTGAVIAVGCGDLMHSTAWPTRCDISPDDCETGGGSSEGGAGNGGAGASSSSPGSGAASSNSSGAGASSASASSAGPGGSTGCGNGNIDAGEECDDANGVAGDGCDGCVVVCTGSHETKDDATAHCYRADPTIVGTWDGARAACIAWGGELVAIGSGAEQALVTGLLAASSWIGANDKDAEGAFVWSNGELLTYTNWNAGEPNDYNLGEDCAQIYGPESSLGLWNDLSCDTQLVFVCERAPPGN